MHRFWQILKKKIGREVDKCHHCFKVAQKDYSFGFILHIILIFLKCLGAVERFSELNRSQPLFFLGAIDQFSEFNNSKPLFLGAIAEPGNSENDQLRVSNP